VSEAARPYGVLFLCTGNSARSILAEALLNFRAGARFRAFSAGSHPTGHVNPLALEVLERRGIAAEGARSKSWDEFAKPGAPALDVVLTVCDNAAGEVCPVWPGHPATAHWGVADPAAVRGTRVAQTQAFEEAFRILDGRIRLLVDLPIASLDRASLRHRVQEIGRISPGSQGAVAGSMA
jgi:protein-tyrosine-phosphatase